MASKCKSPSVALGFVQAAGLACHERGAESQSKSGICLLGVCENETNFGTVFGSTSGTWNKPRLLAFLTSGPKTGTKNEPKLDTRNGHQSRLRNSRKSATQAGPKNINQRASPSNPDPQLHHPTAGDLTFEAWISKFSDPRFFGPTHGPQLNITPGPLAVSGSSRLRPGPSPAMSGSSWLRPGPTPATSGSTSGSVSRLAFKNL